MRKPNGRKRVEMAKMQKKSNLEVTFSKRRVGLFKKATELAILCEAKVATVIFSPSNKIYTFGHPSVNSIVDKFLGLNLDEPTYHNDRVGEVINQLNQMEDRLRDEKRHGETLQTTGEKAPVLEELNYFQLQELSEALEAKQKEVERMANQQKENGIVFPYRTLGGALALSSGSDAGPSGPRD
ncbi:agamous-like MADS-box protein AGL62 [Lycium ferocissimum]|uniref:agamous-like MADS-box protein AGL62 n=1 Tax=Lycium ferocissimum TaxID=112874 RepID=UPI002814AEFE|nr:agamous-like MADS-box protein AGL62 [Lycium ferocissimum]